MAIKIPSEIEPILNTNSGREPVAYIDVYEERGDFDVIDTQNQFKAITDPAVVNDVNVDFDRKPGFAVLGPGKKVNAANTNIISGWGNVSVDYSAFSVSFMNLQSAYTVGAGRLSNGNLGFWIVMNFTSGDLGRSFFVLSTDNGKTWAAVFESTDVFSTGLATNASYPFRRGGFFSGRAIIAPETMGYGNIEYTSDGFNFHTVSLGAISSIEGGDYNAIIKSVMYHNGYFYLSGMFGSSAYAKIYRIEEANPLNAIAMKIPSTPGGNTVFSCNRSTINNLFYYCYNLGSQDQLGYANLQSTPATHNLGYTFPWSESARDVRVLSDGNICVVSIDMATNNIKLYKFDVNDLSNPVITDIRAYRLSELGANSDDQNVVLSNSNGSSAFRSTDGVNLTEYTGSGVLDISNFSVTRIAPYVVDNGERAGIISYNSINSSHAFSNASSVAGSYKYEVAVADQYYTDSGRGKK